MQPVPHALLGKLYLWLGKPIRSVCGSGEDKRIWLATPRHTGVLQSKLWSEQAVPIACIEASATNARLQPWLMDSSQAADWVTGRWPHLACKGANVLRPRELPALHTRMQHLKLRIFSTLETLQMRF
ncbi:hypothetical protein WJX72_008346 [[Myrmecia] bisecta]|uniref:Uncharacterized protein n=1 Tax=[Myrmecia] bisecta TaxID=41462 RepID=A0AAW1R7V4_9CHLO